MSPSLDVHPSSRATARTILSTAIALAVVCHFPSAVARPAAVIPVTSCADSGAGTLRSALGGAVAGDHIDLTALACSRISLLTGALVANVNLSIEGPGAARLTIDGLESDRVLLHLGDGTLTLSGITLAGGTIIDVGYARGGCLYSTGDVVLDEVMADNCTAVATGELTYALGGAICANDVTLISSSVTRSRAFAYASYAYSFGGGIYARGALTVKYSSITDNVSHAAYSSGVGFDGAALVGGDVLIEHSTIARNRAEQVGGLGLTNFSAQHASTIDESTLSGNVATRSWQGSALFAAQPLVISHSTITGNVEANGSNQRHGAGLFAASTVDLTDSIVAGNVLERVGDTDLPDDISGGASASLGGSHALVGYSTLPTPPDTRFGDPGLRPLAANGGLTETHALTPGSQAIDHGSQSSSSNWDQRGTGHSRRIGTSTDIGAFESPGDRIFLDGFEPFF